MDSVTVSTGSSEISRLRLSRDGTRFWWSVLVYNHCSLGAFFLFFFFLVCPFTRNTSLKTSSSILLCFTWQLTFSLICPLPACSGHCQAVCFFSEYHLLGQLVCKDTLYPALSSAFAASKRELWFEEILSWVGESKLVLFELWGWHTPSSMQVQLCPIVSAWRRLFLCPQQARIILGKQTALPEGTSNSSSRQNNNSWLLHQ